MRRSLLPFIHSTFRDVKGKQVLPSGLQWSLPGVSHVRFVLSPLDPKTPDALHTESPEFRFSLVQAFNRWCAAKDLNDFKTGSDIESVTLLDDRKHFQVHWKDTKYIIQQSVRYQDIGNLLRNTVAKQQPVLLDPRDSSEPSNPVEVWIQGQYHGPLQLDTVDDIIASIPYTENRLEFKQSSLGQIRIERYYRGKLRKNQAWDHIWDNLVALEDPQLLLDSNTIIGTATLKDWVVGGTLTSRLFIQEEEDRILFLRPLHNDDPETSDRRYELTTKDSDENNALVIERMEMVRHELERLRYLASLKHPFMMEASTRQQSERSSHDAKVAEIRGKLGHGRKKRRFFGL